MLVDSHCHLNYPEFADLPAVLARAEAAGIGLMQTIGCKRSDFAPVLEIARRDPRIFCSIGVHPHEAEHHEDLTLEELLGYAADPKVIGLGETGLDYYYEHSPRDVQQRLFRMHIEASRISGLPVIVHTRDADEDTIRILREEHAKGAFPGLIHCFSSGPEMAEAAVELGLSISISGIITFRKAQELRDTVAKVPLESLLVETDAPYLAPEPHRGKKNEPAFTAITAQKLAEIKGVSLAEITEITTNNFMKLFAKAKAAHEQNLQAGQGVGAGGSSCA
jgi:TatD DNase family protein